MPDRKDLELLILGHAPIVQIDTHEERRALDLLVRIAVEHTLHIYQWSVTEGLRRLDIDLGIQKHNAEPKDVLAHIKSSVTQGVFVLLDFDPFIKEPVNARFVKEIAMAFEGSKNKIVFISHTIDLPADLKRRSVHFELSLPNADVLDKLITEEVARWQNETGKKVSIDNKAVQSMIENLTGLTYNDARRLIRNSIMDDDAINTRDLPQVLSAKYRLLNSEGVISYEFDTARFSEVGGMNKLKYWLQQREKVFRGQVSTRGPDRPRGVLLLGVQGCGKSLAAKAIAGIWNVPLLRFDFSALYDKYYGESERNLRNSLKTAESMAPCVLWIDEIEKGISGDRDEGTSKRILGALLTWLAENKKHVFVVATANDIEALPPELIRKGRLDEIFFVDLPEQDVRKQIFAIHLDKREIELSSIDLDKVAAASEGFSGSEIEQVVVSAIYASHAGNDKIDTQLLLDEISQTRPLSVVMAEHINQLRQWAAERTVPVN